MPGDSCAFENLFERSRNSDLPEAIRLGGLSFGRPRSLPAAASRNSRKEIRHPTRMSEDLGQQRSLSNLCPNDRASVLFCLLTGSSSQRLKTGVIPSGMSLFGGERRRTQPAWFFSPMAGPGSRPRGRAVLNPNPLYNPNMSRRFRPAAGACFARLNYSLPFRRFPKVAQ